MKIVITACLLLLASSVAAEEQRVYQTDAYGRVQHNKPSYSVGEDGRIVEVDPYGNKQHHKPQYVIRKDRVYETTAYGEIRYSKPSYTIEKDGRVVETEPYGHKRYDRPQYQVEGGKVYETDAYGRVNQQKFRNQERKVTFEVSRGGTGGEVTDVPVGSPMPPIARARDRSSSPLDTRKWRPSSPERGRCGGYILMCIGGRLSGTLSSCAKRR